MKKAYCPSPAYDSDATHPESPYPSRNWVDDLDLFNDIKATDSIVPRHAKTTSVSVQTVVSGSLRSESTKKIDSTGRIPNCIEKLEVLVKKAQNNSKKLPPYSIALFHTYLIQLETFLRDCREETTHDTKRCIEIFCDSALYLTNDEAEILITSVGKFMSKIIWFITSGKSHYQILQEKRQTVLLHFAHHEYFSFQLIEKLVTCLCTLAQSILLTYFGLLNSESVCEALERVHFIAQIAIECLVNTEIKFHRNISDSQLNCLIQGLECDAGCLVDINDTLVQLMNTVTSAFKFRQLQVLPKAKDLS
ncbi:DgyrCDS6127 [Dimorphilus gyrociliatus]|uniref:DgyrCDS6127 n=1 Tax=Dimorphilus gyrociliatus TaxID=2664684 RepID=A0A7I8VM29_9ANNE|nr:DgyrCDS6127 [Dimorphilus gyrociliatus]